MSIKYFFWLIGQVIVGGVTIAVDMLRPSPNVKPVVVHYPLRITSERDLAAFSTSVTMTPGTLSLGFHDGFLDVHAVYGQDPDEVLAGLAEMEERLNPAVKELDRGAPGQGPGNPLRSTLIAGRSDDNYGPTETFDGPSKAFGERERKTDV
ncbi:MAG: monovalent cation/H+ antiporter subunit E [Corynebacterium glucuronolyticum]|nr:monovalent cation/H+ antiporter subunit E [Corynebacterium glucuronolyticum]MDD7586155.1 monovalent cation/H+ antiporter subunit E [Mycobacteriaceae bacterium]MDY5834158.1 monovalent cation/H+ antiporter subunit E [Corynebacterium glucuronolyticum]